MNEILLVHRVKGKLEENKNKQKTKINLNEHLTCAQSRAKIREE